MSSIVIEHTLPGTGWLVTLEGRVRMRLQAGATSSQFDLMQVISFHPPSPGQREWVTPAQNSCLGSLCVVKASVVVVIVWSNCLKYMYSVVVEVSVRSQCWWSQWVAVAFVEVRELLKSVSKHLYFTRICIIVYRIVLNRFRASRPVFVQNIDVTIDTMPQLLRIQCTRAKLVKGTCL